MLTVAELRIFLLQDSFINVETGVVGKKLLDLPVICYTFQPACESGGCFHSVNLMHFMLIWFPGGSNLYRAFKNLIFFFSLGHTEPCGQGKGDLS